MLHQLNWDAIKCEVKRRIVSYKLWKKKKIVAMVDVGETFPLLGRLKTQS